MVFQPGYRASIEHDARYAAVTEGIRQFTYKFIGALTEGVGNSPLNGHMSNGDAISVPVESDLLALARGFIVELTPHKMVVGVDHELCRDTMSTYLVALWKVVER
jgi:DNA replication ATP-dependent helicase Dna2